MKRDNTKNKIVTAAWKLFYKQGYESTTVEDIIKESGTSKGSFYHYFNGKDALLSSLSMLFDEKYQQLMETIDKDMNRIDMLCYLNRNLFEMIEETVSVDLLARLLSSQLVTRGDRHLLNRNRIYFKLLRQIITEGQERNEISRKESANSILKAYAMFERGLMYDWCLSEGEYSLTTYSEQMMCQFLQSYKK